jgi:hypothetical protein
MQQKTILPNTGLLCSLEKIEAVIATLSSEGVTVTSIVLHGGKPVIRVRPCAWCDLLVRNGHALYVQFGSDQNGRYRQGVYALNECRIVWSESLH